jgi:hypothetical protein
MGSTAFLFALGTMRPVSGVPPWTMRLAMKKVGRGWQRVRDCLAAPAPFSARRERFVAVCRSGAASNPKQ